MKQWQPVPVAGLQQRDSSDGNSYLKILFNQGYSAEMLRLYFSGPKYYSRQIAFSGSYYGSHALRPRVPLIVSGQFEDAVLAVIGNAANPALQLDSVQALRTADYLVAWLEPGKYGLRYSDRPMTAALYDLDNLRDSLSALELPVLTTQQEQLLAGAVTGENPVSPWPKIFMWTAIIAVLGGLVFASRALMQKVNS
jgi:hypothetical protein